MVDNTAKKHNFSDSDQYRTGDSLLESLLFLMTNRQREYFLNNSLSYDIVYANKAPSFNFSMCMVLSWAAQRQLIELDSKTNIPDKVLHKDSLYSGISIDILKSELEAGVQVKIPLDNWNYNNDDNESKELTVYIVTRKYSFKCKLKKNGNNAAYLLAIYAKCSPYYNKKSENRDNASDDLSNFKEPFNNGFIDLSKSVHQPEKNSNRTFKPHIKTAWNLYQSYSTDIESFSLDAFENIVWQVSNNSLSETSYIRRKHLGELEKVVNLSQLAMQFPYTAVSGNFCDEIHTTEYRNCKLRVHGPDDEVTKIGWAYVYADDKQEYGQHKNQFHRMTELLNRQIKRIAVLELERYENKHHIFKISSDRSIPSEGYLVDIGVESQVIKQVEAIRFLTKPKSRVHLLKLTSLLDRIVTDRFDDFDWKHKTPEMFDKLLTARQIEAVSKAINTPDICLIQGPPGTGKTRVISEIIQQASKLRWKTLLAAPTHVAVDNVLERIGDNDNISPIRCVNKDKIPDLPKRIQQFTFQDRKDSLVNRSQSKIKQDITKLKREKSNLDQAVLLLEELNSLYSNEVKLESQEQSLKKLFSSVEKTVQVDFCDELKEIAKKLKKRDKQLKISKNQFENAQKNLTVLKEKLSQLVSGSYTGKDKAKFKAAQIKVDEIQGEVLKEFKAKLKNSEQQKGSVKKKIELIKSKIERTKKILVLLDDNQVPNEVNKAVQAVVATVSAKQDRIIESKVNSLENAKDSLQANRKDNERLVGLLETVAVKQQKLAGITQKSFLHKILSPVWWQSRLINFDDRWLQYSSQLQKCDSKVPVLKSRIEESEKIYEDSKLAKETALKKIGDNELIKQHNKYRSDYGLFNEKLMALNRQAQELDSEITTSIEKTKKAQYDYDEASRIALELTLEQTTQELKACVNEKTEDAALCGKEFELCKKKHMECQRQSDELQNKICQIVAQSQQMIKTQIYTLEKEIIANYDQIGRIKKLMSDLIGCQAPEKQSDIPKVQEEVSAKMAVNKRMADFSNSWLNCLISNSDELSNRMSKYTNLICATTVGIASDEYFGDGGLMEQKQFDLLIIDEAGKVTEPEFLVAASRAKKWVIVGDHKQLPPYYDRKLDKVFTGVNEFRSRKGLPPLDPSVLKVGYFENLWSQLSSAKTNAKKLKSRFVTLDIQRRMHPDLAEFIADMFYPGQYNSPKETEFIEDKTLNLSNFNHAITFIEVSPPKSVRRLETNLRLARNELKLSCKTGYANLSEAVKTIEVLKSLLSDDAVFAEQQELNNNNESAATIGIIAFYAGQVELIKKLMRENTNLDAKEKSNNGQFICKGFIDVIVNTVDSFQGKECSIVILSFTRSNPHRNIGFVDDANRLNVAMSRARKKLILLGDTKTFFSRAQTTDKNIKRDDTYSITAERVFFEKLVQYIEGRGEIKKAFHVWRIEDEAS